MTNLTINAFVVKEHLTNLTSNNTVEKEDFTMYADYRAGVYIWTVISPILILFGTIGNTLSIYVFTRKCLRTSTTALYLTFLAFSDLVVLYSGLLRQWLIYFGDVDVRHLSSASCKIDIWLVYSSLTFSAWILIWITLERVFAVWFPYRIKSLCTRKAAVVSMVFIGIVILGVNSHLLYGMGFIEKRDQFGTVIEVKKCESIDEMYSNFFEHTWVWIDLCAFCLIPFIAILLGNALILFKMMQNKEKTLRQNPPTNLTGNRQQRQSSMTAMLLSLNIVFLLSTSPISIYNIGYSFWIKNANGPQMAMVELWWAIVNMFMYTNNSINFVLYCLSGTKFRHEAMSIFCPRRPDTGNDLCLCGRANYKPTIIAASPSTTNREGVSDSPGPFNKFEVSVISTL